MKMTDALLGEHGVFYAQFNHLEEVVPKTEDLSEVLAQAGDWVGWMPWIDCRVNSSVW